jgi:hypothetical protein
MTAPVVGATDADVVVVATGADVVVVATGAMTNTATSSVYEFPS